MKNRIEWEAFKKNLEVSIANEKIWAMGSTGEEHAMHMENIHRLEEQIECIEDGDYDSVLKGYDKSVFDDYLKKERMWSIVSNLKDDLVAKIVELVGERTIDVSDDNIYVSAVEHHCGEGYYDRLISICADGFASSDGCGYAPWHDMVVEDLAMVHDYLLTGEW